MALIRHPGRRRLPFLLAPLLTLLLVLWPAPAALAAAPPAAAAAVADTGAQHYRCDGDPLVLQAFQGAVDAVDLPNSSGGTVPGAYVVLQWRGQTLQLPRTNNAGPPSYTDGRWWWQVRDPDHPDFAQRRGAVQVIACERPA